MYQIIMCSLQRSAFWDIDSETMWLIRFSADIIWWAVTGHHLHLPVPGGCFSVFGAKPTLKLKSKRDGA